MAVIRGFDSTGFWFKGNLHSHTNVSDGTLDPVAMSDIYRENGYSFLCISDHDIYTDFRQELNSESFIILPGVEYSVALFSADGSLRLKLHHIHGILGTEEMQKSAPLPQFRHLEAIPVSKFFGEWDGAKAAQDAADMLASHGCITTYNHPVWSRVDRDEFVNLKNIAALEIYNFGTVEDSNTGYDTTYWDYMLRRGDRVNAFASDDNHNGTYDDSLGGWIMVNAPSLTHDNIIEAIIKGNYYSSSGPEIFDFYVDGDTVSVSCSKVQRVNFIVGNVICDGMAVHGKKGENSLSHAQYKLKGHESYVRVECVDCSGRMAWSNPIYLK